MTKREPLKRCALVILGMHRSGTSAVAAVTSLLGAKAPKSEMGPSANNPKGYFESKAVMQLNEKILESAGTAWYGVDAFEASWIDSPASEPLRREAADVIEREFDNAPLIVFKDPRVCRFPRFWLERLEAAGYEAKILIPYRNPLEVADSLAKRNGLPLTYSCLLWLRYVLDAEVATRSYVRTFVRYEALLGDWKSVFERVGHELHIDWPRSLNAVEDDINDYISVDLRRSRSSVDELLAHEEVPCLVKETYTALVGLSDGTPDLNGVLDRVDSVRDQFDAICNVAAPALIYGRQAEIIREEQRKSIKNLKKQVDKLNGQLEQKRGEIVSLRSKVEEGRVSQNELRAEVVRWRYKFDRAEVKLNEARLRGDRLKAQLRKLYRSKSWRITAPLRALVRSGRWFLRNMRRGVKLMSWLGTGQYRRAGKGVMRYYRRRVPLAVRKLIPKRLRNLLKRIFFDKSVASLRITGGTRSDGVRRTEIAPREFLLTQAKSACDAEEWSTAASYWRRLIETYDKPPVDVLLGLGRAYRNLGLLERADEIIALAHNVHGDSFELDLEYAELLTARGAWLAAVARWCSLVREYSPEPVAKAKKRIADACVELVANGEYESALKLIYEFKRYLGETKSLLAVEGVVYLRANQMERSKVHWQYYWERALTDEEFERAATPKSLSSKPAIVPFPVTEYCGNRSDERQTDKAARICIYTAIFGDYDTIDAPPQGSPGVEFVCFTDRPSECPGWDVRIVEREMEDPFLKNRKVKILAHKYLEEYDYSFYVDANICFQEDPLILINRWFRGKAFVAWRHPERSDIYRECEAILISLRHPPGPVFEQYECFRREKVPEDAGLIEASVLWRAHHDSDVKRLMETWWTCVFEHCGRDQPALAYSIWKTGVRPEVMPEHIGTIRKNSFFGKRRHNRTAVSMRRKSVMVNSRLGSHTPVAGLSAQGAASSARSKAVEFGNKPLNISWMLDREYVRGWAYSNNTNRFIKSLPRESHEVNTVDGNTDVALYFDALIYENAVGLARHNVLRLGGPRPLRRMFDGNINERCQFLRQFDALIALNPELARVGRLSGVPTYLVPNGLPLDEWHYCYNPDRERFVVGFAGSIKSTEERRLKGYDYVRDVCQSIGIELLSLEKGTGKQIPHERMREEFFEKISCIVHPVAEGKEGCSNTIMEALACGVPVITTRFCGYHGAFLEDSVHVLYVRRNRKSIFEGIERLRKDYKLRRRLSMNGRQFAVKHHDISRVAVEYKNVFTSVVQGTTRQRVSFLPVKTPVEDIATARLRCAYMVDALNEFFGAQVRADLGMTDDADVIVVSQLCSESTLIELQERRLGGAKIVYDCCDPYYNREEEVYDIYASQRFWELAALADVLTVSTDAMKHLLEQAGVRKPIVVVPDMVDYCEQRKSGPAAASQSVIWFGNPGHGNLDSGLWALDHLKERWHYRVTLLTNPSAVSNRQDLNIEPWAFQGFVDRLRKHGLAVISQNHEQVYKSENRLITALANGVPAVSIGSTSGAKFLNEIGFSEMSVSAAGELDRAVECLVDTQYRWDYIRQAQAHIEAEYSPFEVSRRFWSTVLSGDSIVKDELNVC